MKARACRARRPAARGRLAARLAAGLAAFVVVAAAAGRGQAAADGPAKPPPASVLSLEESLRQALQHSPRLRAAHSRLEQSLAQWEQAQAPLRPQVGLDAQAGPQSLGTLPPTYGSVALTLSQTLGRPEDVRLRLQRAELAPRMARLTEEQTRAQVVAEVESAYWGVLEAQSALATGQLQLQAATEALRVARERFAAGVLSEAELLAAEAAEARARQAVTSAEQALALAYDALYRLMGVAQPQSLPTLQPPPPPAVPFAGQTVEELRQHALQARPDLAVARMAVEDAELALRQAVRSSRPSLQLQASYQWTNPTRGVTLSLDDQTRLQFTVFGDEGGAQALSEGYRVVLRLAWNLADGGLSAARVREAQQGLEQARLQLEELEAQVLAELAQRQAELTRALQQLLIAERVLAEALARQQAVRRQLESGMATSLELLQAQAQVAQARHQQLQAQAQLARARTALLVAAGTPVSQLLAHVTANPPSPARPGQGPG